MKYGNHKVSADGRIFDSKKEYRRYEELKLLLNSGVITDLETQVKYELVPSQKVNGKIKERPLHYIADFVYKTKDGITIVEDVKSEITRKTPQYIIKRKLMLFLKGIEAKEV